ncbi:hypothetical protein Hanom_Chr07g00603931 [Helianthus anomalus]
MNQPNPHHTKANQHHHHRISLIQPRHHHRCVVDGVYHPTKVPNGSDRLNPWNTTSDVPLIIKIHYNFWKNYISVFLCQVLRSSHHSHFYRSGLLLLLCSIGFRLCGMGQGLGRRFGTNADVTTPGGLGFGRGLLGGGFSPCVGRGYPHDMTEPQWPRALAL